MATLLAIPLREPLILDGAIVQGSMVVHDADRDFLSWYIQVAVQGATSITLPGSLELRAEYLEYFEGRVAQSRRPILNMTRSGWMVYQSANQWREIATPPSEDIMVREVERLSLDRRSGLRRVKFYWSDDQED